MLLMVDYGKLVRPMSKLTGMVDLCLLHSMNNTGWVCLEGTFHRRISQGLHSQVSPFISLVAYTHIISVYLYKNNNLSNPVYMYMYMFDI